MQIKSNLINQVSIFTFVFLVAMLVSSTSYAQWPMWKWAKSYGSTQHDYGNSICTDSARNIIVTGTFDGSIDFETTTLTSAGSEDLFVAKYDANGNTIWVKSFGGTSLDNAESIICDAGGNLFLTGFFRSPTITFGSFILTNPNAEMAYDQYYLVKLDSEGNTLWAVTSEGDGNMDGNTVNVDNSGNVVVSGMFSGSNITFGEITLNNSGNTTPDIFVIRYNPDGNVLWAKSAGGSSYDYSRAVATSNDGSIYVTGTFESAPCSFGSLVLTNSGYNDLFVTKYDASGNEIWATSATGSGDDQGTGIVVDKDGNIIVAGSSSSETLTFDNEVLTGNDYDKIFVSKYDNNGNTIWAKMFGGDDNDEAYSVATTNGYLDNIVVTGEFSSSILNFSSIELKNSAIGYSDIYLLVLNNDDGSVHQALQGFGNDDDEASFVTVDKLNNIYLTGNYRSTTLTFANNTVVNSVNTGNSTDLFIAKAGISVGINEHNGQEHLTISPNPATEFIKLKTNQTGLAKIMDMHGKLVKSILTNKNALEINIANLPRGTYYMKVQKQNKTMVGKFIKN